jgi:hypothetical protein
MFVCTENQQFSLWAVDFEDRMQGRSYDATAE